MRRGWFRAVLPVIVLVTGIMASSCGGGGSSGSSSRASWTYMVYMAADNTLSPYAEDDMNEMEAVGSTGQVKIVVEAEFKYVDPVTTPGIPETTMRGLVARDDDAVRMGSWYTEIGNKNMANPSTLTEFIAWAARTYPAEHYALVIWSHGMGWKGGSEAYKGVISDPPGPVMPMPDLSAAIRDSGVTIEVVNFDTCLMGMYEVAYELKGLASYVVFSEEAYPAYGDPYNYILGDLVGNPSMSGRQLAETIVTKSFEFYKASSMTVTRSAVDMAAVDELHAGISDVAEYCIAHMDASLKALIEEARNESFDYDYPTNIDLGDFLQRLYNKPAAPEELKSLINALLQGPLQQVIVANSVYQGSADASSTGITESKGIAIYLPSSDPGNGQISLADLSLYSTLACNQPTGEATWSDFLNSFLL